MTELDAVMARAQLLLILEEQEHSFTTAISNESHQSEVQELQDQMAMLAEQVAELTTAECRCTQRCFSCNRQGQCWSQSGAIPSKKDGPPDCYVA